MNIFKSISKRRKAAKARRLQLPPLQPLKPAKRSASDQTASQSAHGFGSADNRSQELTLADTTSSSNPVEVVEAFFEALNRHASLQELLQYAANKDVRVKFEDTPSALFFEMMQEMRSIFRSFPDFSVSYESITLVEGVVVTERFGARGTHTGMPYGIGPFPRIPATHKHVVPHDSRIMMSVDTNGKLTKLKIVSDGPTGPRAMYTGIGGSLELPQENPEENSEPWYATSH